MERIVRDVGGSQSALPIISSSFFTWLFSVSCFVAVFSLVELFRGAFSSPSSPLVSSHFQRYQQGMYGSVAGSAGLDEEASYESLLAISDTIGYARKGLTLEQISLVCTPLVFNESQNLQSDAVQSVSCAVCLMKFVHDEKLFVLPCGCQYHEYCVTPWLESSPTCPCCRSSFR